MFPLLLALGCSGPADERSPIVFTNLVAEDSGDLAEDTGVLGDALLSVTLRDGEEQPCAGWTGFLLSNSIERSISTDPDGRISVAPLSLGAHLLHLIPPDGSSLAEILVPLILDDAPRELTLYAPALDPPAALAETPQLLPFGDGLELLVGLGDLAPPLFEEQTAVVTGVRLAPSQWPPTDGISTEVLAVWLLSPLGHRSEVGLPMRVTETLGVIPGESARVWVSSLEEPQWLDMGSLTSDGAFLDGDALLPVLSTVVLTRE